MADKMNEQVIVAFFGDAGQADGAAGDIMRWEGANEDIKLGAIGL